MSDKKSVRLNKLVKEFNVSIDRIFSFLEAKGIDDLKPTSKVSHDVYMDLLGEFDSEKKAKLSAELLSKEKELVKAEEIIKQQEAEEKAQKEAEAAKLAKIKAEEEAPKKNEIIKAKVAKKGTTVLGKVELEPKVKKPTKKEAPKASEPKEEEVPVKKVGQLIKASAGKLKGVKITGQKIDLSQFKKPENVEKKKRVRIVKAKVDPNKFKKSRKPKRETVEISPEEAQKRVRETLEKYKEEERKNLLKTEEKKDKHIEMLLKKQISKLLKTDQFKLQNSLQQVN